MATIDPTQLTEPSQIPPSGSRFVGSSPCGLADVFSGTLTGDVDAPRAAQELLATESNTGGLANADYIYNQLSALYGGAQLPDFRSPSGNTVKSVVFVSGSRRGTYGAFHIPGTQAGFDRIVVDSLNVSGRYSSDSKLGTIESDAPGAGRKFLSTGFFANNLVESFELLTRKASPGRTDGEAVSRILAYKLAPEMAVIPGFNGGVTQQWWRDGHPDFVNDNSQNDQSTDGNGAGVMFLFFLNDYLGVPMVQILAAMPQTRGAPLGQTYVNLLRTHPELAKVVGTDGPSAFRAMVSFLQQNARNPDGSLKLPADGNPFPAMQGAKQGGLFTAVGAPPAPSPASPAVPNKSRMSPSDEGVGIRAASPQPVRSAAGPLPTSSKPAMISLRGRVVEAGSCKGTGNAMVKFSPPVGSGEPVEVTTTIDGSFQADFGAEGDFYTSVSQGAQQLYGQVLSVS